MDPRLSVRSLCLSLISLTFFFNLHAEEDLLAQISRYRGYYLWKNELKDPSLPYQLEEIINGMRLAEKGQTPEFDDLDRLQDEMDRLVSSFVQRKHTEALIAAETYLKEISRQADVKEIVKDKLYYKQLAKGFGNLVSENSTPFVKYSVKTLESGEDEEISLDDPKQISLSNTIVGFEKGVVGMRVGEKRTLYIHPDLGYGAHTGWLPANSLIIIDIEVKDINLKSM